MGIPLSGNPTIANGSFTSFLSDMENYVSFVKDALVTALWARQKIMAQITFIDTFAIVSQHIFTIDGTGYKFNGTGSDGYISVPTGADQSANLTNLGSAIQNHQGWGYNLNGLQLQLIVHDDGNPDHDGNNKTCICPANAGVWDTSIATGTGITTTGGYRLTSRSVNSTPMVLWFTTQSGGQSQVLVQAGANRLDNGWVGLLLNNNWQIIANKYQMFLYVPLSTANGTFMFASHLSPAKGVDHFNYMTCPTSPIQPINGNRTNLASISGSCYVDMSAAANSINEYISGNSNYLCFPGLGSGGNVIEKLNNRIAGKNVLDDQGFALPYEAALQAAAKNPSGPTPNFSIGGYIWDSAIYSGYSPTDISATIDGSTGIVILSQQGGNNNQCGSMVTLI